MRRKYQYILIFFLFIILASLSFIISPFFDLREFAVHSRSKIDKNSLRPYLEDFYGRNILFLKKSDLEESLHRHKLISSFHIEKSYPSKIHIIIEEREAAAWIDNSKKIVFSADGIILQQLEKTEEIDVPQIVGFDYLFFENRLLFPEEMDKLLNILSKFKDHFLNKIIKITYDDNILKLYLKNDLAVNLGGAVNLEEKFALLNSILIKLEEGNQEGEYINLKVVKHPVVKLRNQEK